MGCIIPNKSSHIIATYAQYQFTHINANTNNPIMCGTHVSDLIFYCDDSLCSDDTYRHVGKQSSTSLVSLRLSLNQHGGGLQTKFSIISW